MTIAEGTSELDTMTLRLVDAGLDVTCVDRMRIQSAVTTPCDAWEATVIPDDSDSASALLLPGAKIQILINGKLQLTGYIDKREVHSAGGHGGTSIHLAGRDTLGPIVDGCIDPKFKIDDEMTLGDLLAAVLGPLGVGTIYNDGSLNQNVQTGKLAASAFTKTTTVAQVPSFTLNADGTATQSFTTQSAMMATGKNPALATIKLKKIKPHIGEGVHQFVDRVLKRFGLRMSAAVDGSGVVIDAPDYTTSPVAGFIRSSTSPDLNNVEDISATWDLTSQPSCIIAYGVASSDATQDTTPLRVIAVNELAGVDASGTPLPDVQTILAQYQDAKVLNMRNALFSVRSGFSAVIPCRPLHMKDDESKTGLELEGYVRREMARRQHKAFSAQVVVEGLSQNSVPFATNTQVTVDDDVLGLDTTLYVVERDLEQSRGAGTKAHLTLILPHSLDYTTSDDG